MPPLINIAIGIAARTPERPEILVARRRADAIRGGLWEFPGGKIEAGESPQAAVRREFLEEIGCAVEVVAELPATQHHDPALPRESHVRLIPFVVCLEAGSTPAPNSAQELRWVPLDALRNLAWPPANWEVIDALERWWNADGAAASPP